MKTSWKNVAEQTRRPLVFFATCTFFAVGVYLVVGAPGLPFGSSRRNALKLLGAFVAAKIALDFLYRALVRPIDDRKLEDRLGDLWDEKIDRYLLRSARYGFAGFEDDLSPAALFGARKGARPCGGWTPSIPVTSPGRKSCAPRSNGEWMW